jgi:hypothetical protein
MNAKPSDTRYWLFEVVLASGTWLAPITGKGMFIARQKLSRRSDFVEARRYQEISKEQFDLAVAKCPNLPSIKRMITPNR